MGAPGPVVSRRGEDARRRCIGGVARRRQPLPRGGSPVGASSGRVDRKGAPTWSTTGRPSTRGMASSRIDRWGPS